MNYLPNIGETVIISNFVASEIYIIRSIKADKIFISPKSSPENISTLVLTSSGWQVYGTSEKYFITFPNRILTGNLFIDSNILNNTDDAILLKLCNVNKYISTLCNNQNLWIERMRKYFNETTVNSKPVDMDWKDYYFILKKYGNIENAKKEAFRTGDVNTVSNLFKYQLIKDGETADLAEIALTTDQDNIINFLLDNNLLNIYDYLQLYQSEVSHYFMMFLINKDITNFDYHGMADSAVLNDYHDLLNILVDRGIYPTSDAYINASYSGNIGMLNRLEELGIPLNCETADAQNAAATDEVLSWFVDRGLYPPY